MAHQHGINALEYYTINISLADPCQKPELR